MNNAMDKQAPLSTADMAAAGQAPQPTPAAATPNGPAANGEKRLALFENEAAQSLRTRWMEVQTGFVDEPRQAVQQADNLVAEVMQQLAQKFASARTQLEQQWTGGGDVSTEELRLALQRYRSFFDRLLSL